MFKIINRYFFPVKIKSARETSFLTFSRIFSRGQNPFHGPFFFFFSRLVQTFHGDFLGFFTGSILDFAGAKPKLFTEGVYFSGAEFPKRNQKCGKL